MRPTKDWLPFRAALGLLLGLVILLSLPGASSQVLTDYTLTLNGPFIGIRTGLPAGVPAFDETDLILAFDMETIDGSTMTDFSPEGNDGAITGTADILGVQGRARDFTTDTITMASAPSFFTETLTLSAWINSDSLGAQQGIITRWGGAPAYYGLWMTSGGAIRAGTNDGATTLMATPTAWFFSDTWLHVAFTYNGTHGRIYINGTLEDGPDALNTPQLAAGARDVGVGYQEQGGPNLYFRGRIDEPMIWNRSLSDSEVAQLASLGQPFDFRYVNEGLVPDDVVAGADWIRGSNQTWGAENFSFVPLSFTANSTVWFEGSGTTDRAISWDSFSNVTDADIGFNFTMPAGSYPYWVNDSFQANLTTVAGAISFNWTDWLDGEHLFELGFEISSTPVTSATVGLAFVYAPTITKTNITWSLETGPPFLAIDPSSGIMAGVPLAPQVAVVTVRATASGGLFLEQTFALVVLQIGVLTDAETLTIWLFLILMLVLFVVGPIFRFWFLWMLAGILGVLLGLFTFDLLENFTLTISIMGFGGFLLVGGVLLTIAQGVEAGMTGRRRL